MDKNVKSKNKDYDNFIARFLQEVAIIYQIPLKILLEPISKNFKL